MKDRISVSAEQLGRLGTWELDPRSLEGTWSDGLYALHGLDPGGTAITLEGLRDLLHPEDVGHMTALLGRMRAASPGGAGETVSAEYRIVLGDGSIRHMRVLGRLIADADGSPTRWRGSTQDVTEEVLSDRELRAHQALSLALSDWESFDEGAVGLLRRLAGALEEPTAALWLWDDDREVMFVRAFWSDGSLEGPTLDADLRELALRPGEGSPGLAWERQSPVMLSVRPEDVDPAHRHLALRYGVRSAVSVPAIGSAGTIAVVSFFSTEPRAHGDRLARTLGAIGHDLGRFLQHRTAELHPQPLTRRELQLLQLAAGGVAGPAIAEQLVIEASTVKSHFKNIYEKLGVSDRAGAVAVALRTGLIS